MAVKEEAEKLMNMFSSNDPFYIAKCSGILIDYADLGETLGFYFRNCRIKVININHHLDEIMQRYVCAHELGHAILHPDANTPALRRSTFFSVDKIEIEAHKFAVEMLIPDNQINEYMKLSIYEIAGIFGVPKELAHLKKYEY